MAPPPPEALIADTPWWPWLLMAGLITLGAGLLLGWWWRNGRARSQGIRLRQQAMQDATEAFDRLPAATSRETATEASWILRRFLARAANDPALFETHEEFIGRHDSLSPLPETTRNLVTATFADLAAMKYAAESTGDEPAAIVERSRSLLEQLNQELAP